MLTDDVARGESWQARILEQRVDFVGNYLEARMAGRLFLQIADEQVGEADLERLGVVDIQANGALSCDEGDKRVGFIGAGNGGVQVRKTLRIRTSKQSSARDTRGRSPSARSVAT
jgi:hypothetical protein